MISRKMLPYLNSNSAIREMFEEGKRLEQIYGKENVFDFSLGNPAASTPFDVDMAIIETITKGKGKIHGYMQNQGYESVRNAIAMHLNEQYHTKYAAQNLIMSAGAATGLNIVLKTLLDMDDEVITFAPYFVEYENYVKNYDGRLVIVDTDEQFLPDFAELAAKISKRTKAVLINSPNNPTGVIYSEEVLQKLNTVLRDAEAELGIEIATISDEPYRDLAYDEVYVPWVPSVIEKSLVVYSYSKSWSLAGERIGWVLVPDAFPDADDFIKLAVIANRVIGCVNAPALIQKAIEKTIHTPCEMEFYDYNRKHIYNMLKKLGFEMFYPQGAFFLFIKTPMDDVEFCRLAKEYRILLVPGSAFGKSGYVRLSYSVAHEVIEKSEEAFTEFAKSLGLYSA